MKPRFHHDARLFTAGTPFMLRVKGEGRKRVQLDDCCFALARRRPADVPVWIEHDQGAAAGTLTNLLVHRGVYFAPSVLDPEQISEQTEKRLRIGMPLSVGFDIEASDVDEATGVELVRAAALKEVSIVRTGAVEGARITDKRAVKPAESSPAPAGRTPDRPGEVLSVPTTGTLVRRGIGQVLGIR